MEKEPVHRKLAAVLNGDVKGYSRLMGEDEPFHVLGGLETEAPL